MFPIYIYNILPNMPRERKCVFFKISWMVKKGKLASLNIAAGRIVAGITVLLS